jgi:GcrA cell cycle regulator
MTNLATVWDTPSNVDLLKAMWNEGASASEIARAIGGGVTRNGVISKVHRLKLQKRERPKAFHRRDRVTRDTKPQITGKRGRAGNPGVPSVASIMHRMEGRAKIKPPREIVDDAGVDVTDLIAFSDRKIGQQCAWIPGNPLDGAMCCGKPVRENSQWCEEHHARVYSARPAQ